MFIYYNIWEAIITGKYVIYVISGFSPFSAAMDYYCHATAGAYALFDGRFSNIIFLISAHVIRKRLFLID